MRERERECNWNSKNIFSVEWVSNVADPPSVNNYFQIVVVVVVDVVELIRAILLLHIQGQIFGLAT